MVTKMTWVPDNHVIFPGFYESWLYNSDSEYDFNYNDKGNFEHYMECEIDNFKEFEVDVCKGVADVINDILSDGEFVENVEYADMSSPHEYNFSTDHIHLNVDVNLFRIACNVWYDEKLHEGFDKYLHEKYSSCSGFISFVENNIEAYFDEWDYLDVLLDYWMLTKIYDETDVVDKHYDLSGYEYDIIEVADQEMWNHMKPISEVRYICDECRNDDKKQWLIDNVRKPIWNFYGEEEIKSIFENDDELKARFYKENNLVPYDQHDNVY